MRTMRAYRGQPPIFLSEKTAWHESPAKSKSNISGNLKKINWGTGIENANSFTGNNLQHVYKSLHRVGLMVSYSGCSETSGWFCQQADHNL